MDYTIGKRVRTNFLDQTGVAVDGYRVYFELSDGTVDYIEIEKNRANADTIRAMIEEEVELHDELTS